MDSKTSRKKLKTEGTDRKRAIEQQKIILGEVANLKSCYTGHHSLYESLLLIEICIYKTLDYLLSEKFEDLLKEIKR